MAELAAPGGKLGEHNKKSSKNKRDAVCISGAYGTYYSESTADLRCRDQQVGAISGTDLPLIVRVMWSEKYSHTLQ